MLDPFATLALFGPLGTWEMLIILGIGLLIFGRRLPEVGRSLGKGIVEFKRGLKDISDDIEEESNKAPPSPHNRAAIAGGAAAGGGSGSGAGGVGGALPENAPAFKAPVNAEGEDARVSREPRTE